LKSNGESADNLELETWFKTLLISGTLSIIIFLIQNFVRRFFDFIFEVCIFYIPTFLALLIYLKLKIFSKKVNVKEYNLF